MCPTLPVSQSLTWRPFEGQRAKVRQSCMCQHVNTALLACPQHGMTPLLLASEGGNVDAIRTLLAAGASIAATNKVCRPTTALAGAVTLTAAHSECGH
jgi:hypothetical protein